MPNLHKTESYLNLANQIGDAMRTQIEHMPTENLKAFMAHFDSIITAPAVIEVLRLGITKLELEVLSPGLLEASDGLLDAEGGCATTEEMATLLNMTRQNLHNWVNTKRLLAITPPKRGLLLPRWQVHEGHPLPMLREILIYLADAGETDREQLRWFLNPNYELAGARPLDLLRSGDEKRIVSVLETARVHAEAGH